jgi:hypothetical protein
MASFAVRALRTTDAMTEGNMQTRTYVIIAGITAVIVVGVYLLVEAWRERPADPEEAALLEEQAELTMRSLQDALSERVGEATVGEEQARIDSPRGQALFRRCADWSDLVERAPTDDSRAERDRACAAYREYVLTGEVPD